MVFYNHSSLFWYCFVFQNPRKGGRVDFEFMNGGNFYVVYGVVSSGHKDLTKKVAGGNIVRLEIAG
jgi:hypothetical protein